MWWGASLRKWELEGAPPIRRLYGGTEDGDGEADNQLIDAWEDGGEGGGAREKESRKASGVKKRRNLQNGQRRRRNKTRRRRKTSPRRRTRRRKQGETKSDELDNGESKLPFPPEPEERVSERQCRLPRKMLQKMRLR